MLPLAKIRNESALDKKIPKKMHRDKSQMILVMQKFLKPEYIKAAQTMDLIFS